MANPRTNFLARLDWLTISLYLVMLLFGWMNIFAATHKEANPGTIFDFSQQYSKQFYFILASLLTAVLVLTADSKFWAFFTYPVYALSMLLLPLTLLIGTEVNGALSWISFGPIGIQPSEFAKVATALALAKVLSRFNFQIKKIKNLVILAIITGIPIIFILLQKDTGTALVFFAFLLVLFRQGLSWVVLFITALMVLLFILTLVLPLPLLLPLVSVAALLVTWLYQRNFSFFLGGAGILGALFILAYFVSRYANRTLSLSQLFFIASVVAFLIWLYIIIRKKHYPLLLILFTWLGAMIFIFSVDILFHEVLQPHHQTRINHILGLESDPLGAGYNVNQSKIAIGSGGFLGKGFMNGTQTRFNFVPEQSTDFIFCTIGEEWGFIGSLIVLGLFTGLLIRIIYLAERQRSVFSRVYGYGVVSVLFFHFAVNMGMTIGLVPVIGIPLPFFSYGGSSLLGFTILLFILLRLDTDRYEVIA